MEQQDQQGKQVTITLDKDKLVQGLVVLQFLLLLVFGWQLYGIKQQLSDGGTLAKAGNQAPAPVAAAPSQPSAPAAVADIVVTSDDHVRGNPDAAVTIVEYSDFECPFCQRALPTVEQVLETYGDDVNLVYRHFPLRSIHPNAQKAAEAAECAADQGSFWEYHDLLFENNALVSGGVSQFKTFAAQLGLNAGQFNNCLDSGEKAADVDEDFNSGAESGVEGTPAFFINGTLVSGAQPFSAFQSVIDAELN